MRLEIQNELRPISTISLAKAARGTKRVCQACGVRFYDLARDPIVCPACATEYAVVPATPIEMGITSSYSNKTGWRSKPSKRPAPEAPVHAPEEEEADVALEDAPSDDAAEPGDDLVLEEDTEDGHLTEIIDVPVEKE